MIHHYQEELKNFIEESAKFFGLENVGIYGQFVIMLATLTLANHPNMSLADIQLPFMQYELVQIFIKCVGFGAKFFTMCVGAIATFKFVTGVWESIKNKFKNKEDVNNTADSK
jgi:hypothetical protein